MGISNKEALDCFASDDLIGIGMEADAVRRRLHPEGVVTYSLDGKISYAEPSAPAQAQQAPKKYVPKKVVPKSKPAANNANAAGATSSGTATVEKKKPRKLNRATAPAAEG